jgi:hypothetical protein
MGKPRVPLDPVADLRRRLARLRGAPIAKIRVCVRTWWSDHDFDKCPASSGSACDRDDRTHMIETSSGAS